MGNKTGKNQVSVFHVFITILIIFIQLPKSIKEKVLRLFSLIDTDGSKTIDREETLRFWSKNFPKLNSNELFDQVDKNNDGAIQLDEWVEFWGIVMKSGYSEDEVAAEVRL